MNRADKRKALENKLEAALHRFSVKELLEKVLPKFPNLSLQRIEKCLTKLKLRMTAKNIAGVIIHQSKQVTYEELNAAYNKISLLYVAVHNSLVWFPYALKGCNRTGIDNEDKVKQTILQAIRIDKKNAEIHVENIGGLFYVMILFKRLTRNNGVVFSLPFYVCIIPEEHRLFVASKICPQSRLNILQKALGYEDCKKVPKLSGKNIHSLMQIMKNKNNQMNVVSNELTFQVVVKESYRSKCYIETEERMRHVDHFLGENAPVIEEFTVRGTGEFMGNYSDCIKKPFNTSMTIKSKNIAKSFRTLALKGMIKPPFPKYMERFLYLGRNEITLKQTQS